MGQNPHIPKEYYDQINRALRQGSENIKRALSHHEKSQIVFDTNDSRRDLGSHSYQANLYTDTNNYFHLRQLFDLDQIVSDLVTDTTYPKYRKAIVKVHGLSAPAAFDSFYASDLIIGVIKRQAGSTWTNGRAATINAGLDAACSAEFAFKTLKSLSFKTFQWNYDSTTAKVSFECKGEFDITNIINAVAKKLRQLHFEGEESTLPEWDVIAILRSTDNGTYHYCNFEIVTDYIEESYKATIRV